MSAADSSQVQPSEAQRRMPLFFLTHGGGPSFFIDMPPSHPFFPISEKSINAAWLRSFRKTYGLDGDKAPKAILVVSAHWETGGQTLRITNKEKHTKLYYDYGGFPDYTYKLQYAPPGNPTLSARVQSLLAKSGVMAQLDSKWEFDHGVFVPLKMTFPDAEIPVVELSIDRAYDPAFHVKVGQALAPLRDEGVLIVCSGSSTHNFNPNRAANAAFMDALTEAVQSDSLSAEQRIQRTALEWSKLPHARDAHPREDHFVPYFVAIGAAQGQRGKRVGKVEPAGDWNMASYLFE